MVNSDSCFPRRSDNERKMRQRPHKGNVEIDAAEKHGIGKSSDRAIKDTDW